MKRNGLWTRDFTLITLGTVVSAAGGVAMSLALSLVVFDETSSTWLSGVYAAVSMLPGITLPFALGPLVDRADRKKLIVGLDYLSAALYLLFGLWLLNHSFSYGAYVLFSFLTGCISAVYSLAYEALYPDLIPQGMAQKGYAVSSLIYPTLTAVVTPIASVLYRAVGVETLILCQGGLLLCAATFELLIHNPQPPFAGQRGMPFSQRLRTYTGELREGLDYLRRERGVRSIYLYMMLTNATGQGTQLMALAHLQSAPGMPANGYSLLLTAETVGRMVGGAVHYLFRIPARRRYTLTRTVYQIYQLSDAALLFCPYPVMLVLRFACGFLGVNTATLRTAATQNYIPARLRARVNGLFAVLVSLGMMAVQLAVGALGEVLPYPVVSLLFALLTFAMIFVLIVRNRRFVQPIYDQEI